MSTYYTGMAAEFHVLSVLHRLEITANLTLGSQKAVDIVVTTESGNFLTVDVKGIRGRASWPIKDRVSARSHYYVFVSFLGKIDDPSVSPEVYVVPSTSIARLKAVHKSLGENSYS